MEFKTKLYITLTLSFTLLCFSFYLSTKSINATSDMINHIEKIQLKLSHMSYTLEHKVEINQSNILQAIILKDTGSIKNIHNSFDTLYHSMNNLDNFIQKNDLHMENMQSIIDVIKRRMVGYKSVEISLMEALQNSNKEDIEDALIGFNAITVKFSEDIKKLTTLSNNVLNKNIILLKRSTDRSQRDILYAFLLAVILISFSIFKLVQLHNSATMQLLRAEHAEKEQKKLQSQLLKYNDDLEHEIAKKSKELHQKIYTHFLSGLPNRNKLLEDTHTYNFKQMALLNIDKFQKFNDVYGEETGNIALKMTAEFLQEQIQEENTLLYHIGGDEFVFVVKNSNQHDNNYFIKKIEDVLKNFINENFIYENKKFNLIMSAGIAFSGKKKMLAYADMALKDAKKRNIQLSVFNDDKELEKIHQDDIECHKKLLYALDNKKVVSFFQPIVPLQDTQRVTKYESLVRIEQEDGKIIPPFNFINVAKANRLYDKLTDHVVKNTLNTIQKYKIPCSLNISMEDIDNEHTLQMLYDTFNEFEYNHLLTIELLETEEFKNYKSVYDFCTKVRSYSIKIALDDFGAGYSNFSHILNLPVDYIKIDASLISNIDRDQNSKIMVETIVGLARKLHVETIAEFVSSKEILDIVRDLKVDYAQGFYVGKPEKIDKHIPTT